MRDKPKLKKLNEVSETEVSLPENANTDEDSRIESEDGDTANYSLIKSESKEMNMGYEEDGNSSWDSDVEDKIQVQPKRKRRKVSEPRRKLNPEEREQKRQERCQRMAMRRIEKKAQMTEEEKEEERQKKYMTRVAYLASLTPEEREKKIEEKRKRDALRAKRLRERRRDYFIQNQCVISPEARERRLAAERIGAAKRNLKKKLVAAGVHPEEIQRQLDNLEKTYKPVRALRQYKPRNSTLQKLANSGEISSPKEKAKCSTLSPAVVVPKRGLMGNASYASSAVAIGGHYATPYSTSAVNYPNHNQSPQIQRVQHAYNTQSQYQYEQKECLSQLSVNSSLNDLDVPSTSGPPSNYSYDDDYNDDNDNSTDDNAGYYTEISSLTSTPAPTHVPDFSTHPERSPTRARASLPSFSTFSSTDSKKKFERPIDKPNATYKPDPLKESVCCEICGNAYKKRDLLPHKRLAHHPYYRNSHCTLCCLWLKPPEFQEHFKIHIDNGDVSLSSLDKAFHPPAKRRPRAREIGEKDTPCGVCGKILSPAGFYSHTRKFHNPYYDETSSKCTICGEVVGAPFYYQHFVTAHPGVTISVKPKVLKHERKHVCDECGMGFTSVAILRNHIHYSHGAGRLEENFYRCQLCSGEKVFKRKDAYLIHYNQVHPGENAPLNRCPLCPAMLGKESQKFEHIKDKHPERYFLCQYCKIVRISELGLLTHYSRACKRISVDERLWWAKEKADILTVDKMDLKCELCSHDVNLDSLKRHNWVQHKVMEQDFSCWICDKTLKTRLFLGVHLMEIHDKQPDEWLEKVSKLNVPDAEAAKSSALDCQPRRRKKKTGGSSKNSPESGSSKNMTRGRKKKANETDKSQTEAKPIRKRRERLEKLPSMEVVSEDGEPVIKSEVDDNKDSANKPDKSQTEAKPKRKRRERQQKVPSKEVASEDCELVIKSEPDDNIDPVNKPRRTGPKRKTERIVKRKRLKKHVSGDHEGNRRQKVKSKETKTKEMANLLFVKDEKLNTMHSSVYLQKTGLNTLRSTNGIKIEDNPNMDHVFT